MISDRYYRCITTLKKQIVTCSNFVYFYQRVEMFDPKQYMYKVFRRDTSTYRLPRVLQSLLYYILLNCEIHFIYYRGLFLVKQYSVSCVAAQPLSDKRRKCACATKVLNWLSFQRTSMIVALLLTCLFLALLHYYINYYSRKGRLINRIPGYLSLPILGNVLNVCWRSPGK